MKSNVPYSLFFQLYYTNIISEDTYYPISEIAFQFIYKPVEILSSEQKCYFMNFPLKNKGVDIVIFYITN